MSRAILFDFNGVIIDDEPQHCEALIATLEDYGCQVDRDTYYRDYLGFDDRECFRFAFERASLRADDGVIEAAIERKAVRYAEALRASMQLVPGVPEFIRAARDEDIGLAIVSGALRREIDMVLRLSGLRDCFGTIVAAEDVVTCKPAPEGYQEARRRLGLRPEWCMVIEDSRPGLAAARSSGMRCVMLTTSHPRAALADADLVWDNFIGHRPADLPWPHD